VTGCVDPRGCSGQWREKKTRLLLHFFRGKIPYKIPRKFPLKMSGEISAGKKVLKNHFHSKIPRKLPPKVIFRGKK
jgi:hypothetical protein